MSAFPILISHNVYTLLYTISISANILLLVRYAVFHNSRAPYTTYADAGDKFKNCSLPIQQQWNGMVFNIEIKLCRYLIFAFCVAFIYFLHTRDRSRFHPVGRAANFDEGS